MGVCQIHVEIIPVFIIFFQYPVYEINNIKLDASMELHGCW